MPWFSCRHRSSLVYFCPQTAALSKAFLSDIISSYWVVSLVGLRHRPLGLVYSAAISYRLSFFLLFKFRGVCSLGTHNALWARDRKQVPPHNRWGHWCPQYMFGRHHCGRIGGSIPALAGYCSPKWHIRQMIGIRGGCTVGCGREVSFRSWYSAFRMRVGFTARRFLTYYINFL